VAVKLLYLVHAKKTKNLTRKTLKNKEIEIVNENLLKDPMCMNLKPGGYGGFADEKHRKNVSRLY
jgi:hypothetical protein